MSKVLIHGAGYGARCWDRLLPHLEGDVVAVDLPGRGTRADIALGDVSVAMCADAVRDDIVAHDLHDVVLVGHSMAGIVVPRVVELAPERIRNIVLVSAVIPPHGTRVLDGIDPDVRASVEAAISEGVYTQSEEANVMMLCNDLDDEASAWVLERVVDDAAALLSEPVDLTGYSRGIPTVYVRLDLDCCVPPDVQQDAQARAGAEAVHIEAGHMVMVGQPRRLADVLNRLDSPTGREAGSA
jgi:pimeloyl-ACP methyl ester carboxylesterase